MPILKVANVYFNQSGSSALQYNNDNVVRFIANSFDLPSGTTANRPTGGSLDVGQIRYNTTLAAFEFYTTGAGGVAAWENVATQTVVTAAFGQANTAANGYTKSTFYLNPATFTKPTGLKHVKVTLLGGGGGAAMAPGSLYSGGGGGCAIAVIDASAIPASPITITAGPGGIGYYNASPGLPAGRMNPGAAGQAGGTSSFGSIISATGGGSGGRPGPATGADGTGGAGVSGTWNYSGNPGSQPAIGGDPGYPYNIGSGGRTAPAPLGGPVGASGYGGGGIAIVGTPGQKDGTQGFVVVEEFY